MFIENLVLRCGDVHVFKFCRWQWWLGRRQIFLDAASGELFCTILFDSGAKSHVVRRRACFIAGRTELGLLAELTKSGNTGKITRQPVIFRLWGERRVKKASPTPPRPDLIFNYTSFPFPTAALASNRLCVFCPAITAERYTARLNCFHLPGPENARRTAVFQFLRFNSGTVSRRSLSRHIESRVRTYTKTYGAIIPPV